MDALVGFSPAAERGQYVEGPFGPEGALQDAPKLRIPVLYATARDDRFVSVSEVHRLYDATGSPKKSLVAVDKGPAGWYLFQYNAKVTRAVLTFISGLG